VGKEPDDETDGNAADTVVGDIWKSVEAAAVKLEAAAAVDAAAPLELSCARTPMLTSASTAGMDLMFPITGVK
jgi:hypothetical protein